MDGQLDNHFIGLLEQQIEKSQFVRVDSDVIDNLIRKENKKEVLLTTQQRNALTGIFNSQIPTIDNSNFVISFEAMNENDSPIVITQNEYMRRMKEMAAFQPGMNFYGEMPDSYNLIVNTEHPLIAKIRTEADANISEKLSPITKSIDENNAKITAIRDANKDNNLSEEDKTNISTLEDAVKLLREDETKILTEYATSQPVVKQLIDLALLSNGLLKGEALNSFISRSVSLLK